MFNELYVKKKNELDIKYEKLYDLIGKKLSTKISTANMWEYADNFKCKIECNLALPLWANNKVFKYKETTIEKEMEAARLESFIHLFTNEYIAMHAGGNFVHNIVQVFDIFLKKSTIKMTYYSAHDVTLMYLMSVLGIYEEPPHYGSLLMIDLIKGSEKQDDQEIYIKFYFRDTNLYKPQVRQLYVKGCDEPCSYSKFRVYVIENISNNLKEICQTRRLGHVDSKTMYNLLWFIISFGLFIAAIIILGIAVFKLRKRKYVNIDTESNDAS
ncbi:hypothetical protein A3Q56_06074 [Intoshia linei]|uniref:acid phosphatase n=1 Tax=Intoshia linei TaxID=1819745 RepID=A0A177AXH5_9BILA|nr:hypothetical protein A3Q56_06074 [Intoshia linei]